MNSRQTEKNLKSIVGLATIQSIPVIGTVAALIGDTLGIGDKVLYRKCRAFFEELNDLTDEQRQGILAQFDHKYQSNEDKQEFGERILEYMATMSDAYKAKLASKIFQYWMGGVMNKRHVNMSEDEFYHVLEMMNNIPPDVLHAIEDRYAHDSYRTLADKYSLVQYGLYKLKVDTETLNKSLAQSYGSKTDDLISKTRYGEILESAIWNGRMPNERKE